MDAHMAETKVQIRLSTRDPNLRISDEPTVLLVQTGEWLPWGARRFPVHYCRRST